MADLNMCPCLAVDNAEHVCKADMERICDSLHGPSIQPPFPDLDHGGVSELRVWIMFPLLQLRMFSVKITTERAFVGGQINLDMIPPIAAHYSPHSSWFQCKQISQFGGCKGVSGIHLAEVKDLFRSELTKWVSEFLNTILGIIEMGAFEQMRRVLARWVVARVADQQGMGIFAVVQEVGDAASSPQCPCRPEPSIVWSGTRPTSNPRPALIRSANVHIFPVPGYITLRQFWKWLTIGLGHLISSIDLVFMALRDSRRTGPSFILSWMVP